MTAVKSDHAAPPSDPSATGLIRGPAGNLLNERFLISDLCNMLETYLEPEKIKDITRAYLISEAAHEGQSRMSGEAYINHPLAVARTMAEMRMDAESIMAAILHDVMEDTSVSREQLVDEFGEVIASLVDGVSKLSHLKFDSKAEAQAASFRKMMLAMTGDVRVILVKLSDRLHNMRTLGSLNPEKRRRIARETLEVYVPIAQRLGMNTFRLELERLGFQALHPMRYRAIHAGVEKSKSRYTELLGNIETNLSTRLEEMNIQGRIHSREKNLYSIHEKMREKKLTFQEIHDVFALRIVVDDIDLCYRALGACHTLYKPIPGRFKDYIAIPKSNGYQSLHTVVLGPGGAEVEIQIRSDDMDRVAEQGIAAHWYYKGDEDQETPAQRRTNEWLKSLLELQQNTGNALEFFENVKIDLFPDEVYVFTPQGEIMSLPRGATGLDFAYAVHTDLGNSCVAVKIDKYLSSPSTVLESGQSIEILTDKKVNPNPTWLNFAATARARSSIRHYLNTMEKDEAVNLGKRLYKKAIRTKAGSYVEAPKDRMKSLLQNYHYSDKNALYRAIGLGKKLAASVVDDLFGKKDKEQTAEPLIIKGSEGVVLILAKCCGPVPGDAVIGMMSSGRGMVVHRQECPNISQYLDNDERILPVEWEAEMTGSFHASIRLQTRNKPGTMAAIANILAGQNSNIENIVYEDRDTMSSQITFTVAVEDRQHLAQVIRKLRNVKEVIRISRPFT